MVSFLFDVGNGVRVHIAAELRRRSAQQYLDRGLLLPLSGGQRRSFLLAVRPQLLPERRARLYRMYHDERLARPHHHRGPLDHHGGGGLRAEGLGGRVQKEAQEETFGV